MAGCLPDGGGNGSGSGNNSGTNGTPQGGEVHFITDYYGDSWAPVWGDLEEEFENSQGTQIRIEQAGMSGSQESRLSQLIQAGNPPTSNTSTFDQVAELWSNGLLESTTDLVDEITGVAGDLLTEPFRDSNGDIFQVPHGMYVSNFHYRNSILEEHDLSPPETIQDVLDNARVIDEAEGDMRGYGLAGQRTGKSQDEFQVYLANMGVSPIGVRWRDPDAQNELEIHFPEEKVKYLLQFFKDIAEYSPDPTGIGWTQSIVNYMQGQYAQQYHLNIWPLGSAAQRAMGAENEQTAQALGGLARDTQVKAMPTHSEIDKTENWQWEPAPDGHQILSSGTNPSGAKDWFRWLYASDMDRTVSMYAQEPARFLPTYGDVLGSDTFQNFTLWQEYPGLLEKLQTVQNGILANHYGNVPESNLNHPVALYLTRQWFYGEMINRVVTETNTVQGAYDWGRQELQNNFDRAQQQFS